jgi:hypothetical protein
MILHSQLNKNTYKTADVNKYLTGDKDGLDPVFAGRLAYIAKAFNTVIKITDGARSHEEQAQMYALYKAGKLQATAAVPGTSKHEFRIAADISTSPIRVMSDKELAQFGVYRPLNNEPWHFEPIETKDKPLQHIKTLEPVNLSTMLKLKYKFADETIEYLENYQYSRDLFERLLGW